MRALAAILFLVVGAGLGYGWHEVSPRVLGSAPFCGPKYPGMLRTIPEDEFFPAGPYNENYSDFLADGYGDYFEELDQVFAGPLSDALRTLGEPSLWQMSQQGKSAIRYIRSSAFGHYRVVRVTFEEWGASVNSLTFRIDCEGQLHQGTNRSFELSIEQADQARQFVFEPDMMMSPEIIWNQCRIQLGRPMYQLSPEWNDTFRITVDGFAGTFEVVEPGRYTVTSQENPREDNWIEQICRSLLSITAPSANPSDLETSAEEPNE